MPIRMIGIRSPSDKNAWSTVDFRAKLKVKLVWQLHIMVLNGIVAVGTVEHIVGFAIAATTL